MTVTNTAKSGAVPADTFAARLALARMHAGNLTYSQAAERCGLTRENWANWERGKMPRDKLEVAQLVSEGLDIDLNWLLFGGQLAPEERRPGRKLTRKERAAAPPNVFYTGTSDHTMRHLPTPASQGSPGRMSTASHSAVTPSPVRPAATNPAPAQRRTARRNRPNP